MFGIGMTELIIILAIALLVIGPEKLPELARTLGKGLSEFKKTAEDFRNSIHEDVMVEEEPEEDEEIVRIRNLLRTRVDDLELSSAPLTACGQPTYRCSKTWLSGPRRRCSSTETSAGSRSMRSAPCSKT